MTCFCADFRWGNEKSLILFLLFSFLRRNKREYNSLFSHIWVKLGWMHLFIFSWTSWDRLKVVQGSKPTSTDDLTQNMTIFNFVTIFSSEKTMWIRFHSKFLTGNCDTHDLIFSNFRKFKDHVAKNFFSLLWFNYPTVFPSLSFADLKRERFYTRCFPSTTVRGKQV